MRPGHDQSSSYWCLPAPAPVHLEDALEGLGDAPAGYFVKFCDVCLGMRPPGAPHQLAPDGRRTRTARARISRTSEAEKHARHGQAAAFARGDVPYAVRSWPPPVAPGKFQPSRLASSHFEHRTHAPDEFQNHSQRAGVSRSTVIGRTRADSETSLRATLRARRRPCGGRRVDASIRTRRSVLACRC
ncbi:hypothetical protein VTO73DRAFT_4676 [Trametes versicolor]